MKTEEKAKTIQNVATAVGAIFGAIGMFFGMFQANEAINLKNEVTNLQNSSQQTIVNVISTLEMTRKPPIWHSRAIQSRSLIS